MKIGIVGAIDRLNYGDILFPLIASECLSKKIKDVEFKYYGTIDSDLTKFNAKKTKKISSIKNDKLDYAIVVGGEVLTSSWTGTYLNLTRNKTVTFIIRLTRKIVGYSLSEKISKHRLKLSQKMPWLFTKKDLNVKGVIYNAVGGVDYSKLTSSQIKQIMLDLKDALYISVRDQESKRNLVDNNILNVSVSPDSAFIMSKIFPKDEIGLQISDSLANFNLAEDDYITFQIGYDYGKHNEKTIAQQLAKINTKTGKKIVLLPIGIAAAHKDDVCLKNILKEYKKLPNQDNESIKYIDEPSIYDTIYVISNSALFIGTSLHGNITALSYAKPSFSIAKIKKLASVFKYVSNDNQIYDVDYKEIFKTAMNVLPTDRDSLKANADKLSKMVDENFDKIANLIKEKV